MRNRLILLAFVLPLLLNACKKDNNATPANNNNSNNNSNNNNTNNNTSPYYFKFTFNGTNYDLAANNPQYMSFDQQVLGGYQVDQNNVYHDVALDFRWPSDHTITESDITGLVGRTLYFSDTTIQPELEYDEDLSSGTWFSQDTANNNYYVKVSNVTFLKNDTTLGTPVRVYVVSGTCNAIINRNDTLKAFSTGSFNMVVTRVNQ
jgi:hypothetical protein